MDLNVKSRNGKLSEHQRRHIEEKLGKLTRFLDSIKSVTVEVSTEQRRDAGEIYRVQATLQADRGVILRAEEHANDLFTAIDEVQEILQRQITRYKEKHWRRGKLRRQAGKFVEVEPVVEATPEPVVAVEEDVYRPEIVRMKEFTLRPMFTDEAVEQMELLGHTFFVFRDADTQQISVIYRRKDGNYGLIVPETE